VADGGVSAAVGLSGDCLDPSLSLSLSPSSSLFSSPLSGIYLLALHNSAASAIITESVMESPNNKLLKNRF
jgi:hypothetical protein